jgi:hypothetical protein
MTRASLDRERWLEALVELTDRGQGDTKAAKMLGALLAWPGPCTCECNQTVSCGGCGHAGCGRRRP